MNLSTTSNRLYPLTKGRLNPDSILSQFTTNNFFPDPKKSKIAVAMSGGVDSSTVAYLLKDAGYEIVGITAWIVAGAGKCCDYGVVDAVKICDQLGIEHHAVDLRQSFTTGIMAGFHESYARGETPIPCISCNNDIKWGSLLTYSLEQLGATHLASGHYAKIVSEDDKNFSLYRPKEENKDQTYMLWGLTPQQLSRTVFPLAEMNKPQVREIAEAASLCVAKKADSQDICFVSNGMTNSSYLTKILGEKPGEIVEIQSGSVLGTHKGSYNYTYGQRKGLGIAYSEPLYVVKIDPQKNIVYVGTKDKLQGQVVLAKNRNIISTKYLSQKTFEALAQVRYNMDFVAATITLTDDYNSTGVMAEFHEPISAITPGQALAFYDRKTGQEIIGGAWITEGM